MRYAYDMLGNRIHQLSMEAGARWMLNDVTGKPIRAWDSRGHNFTTTYDALRRPVEQTVRGDHARDSDPRTLNRDILVDKIEYGEGTAPTREALNLRTRIYRHFDSAGVATNARLDANGNPDARPTTSRATCCAARRRLVSDYTAIPDWSLNPQLDAETFEGSTPLRRAQPPHPVHRAAQQPGPRATTSSTSSSRCSTRPTCWSGWTCGWNSAAEPAALLDPAATRRRHRSASPTSTTTPRASACASTTRTAPAPVYGYDPLDLPADPAATPGASGGLHRDCDDPHARHDRGRTAAAAARLQNLHYTYDPAGNITHIQDDAQQTIYFRNKRVEPSNDYTYDALYRLIEATGREHLGQAGAPIPHSPTTRRVGFIASMPGARIRTTATPWARTSSATCTTPSATSCRCSIAAATRRIRAGHAPTTTLETSLIEDGSGGAPLKTSNRLTSTTLNPNGATRRSPSPTSTTPTAT